jgi:hypothetical protein
MEPRRQAKRGRGAIKWEGGNDDAGDTTGARKELKTGRDKKKGGVKKRIFVKGFGYFVHRLDQ